MAGGEAAHYGGKTISATCKLLFPSPGGRGVRGEGRNICNINRLAKTLKPSAFWRRTDVDTYATEGDFPLA
jgi:hypothetical protein